MKDKNKLQPPINPGISLLIVVFLVLCLFTFSAITLSSAISEQKRSQYLGENTREYYEASNKAENTIAYLKDTILKNGKWTLDKAIDLEYDINDTQALKVRLEPLTEPLDNVYFNVTKWQVVQKGTWETDNTLNLYIPE